MTGTDTRAKFSVGEVIQHNRFGYRGVIFDVDPTFQNSDEWYETVARSKPPRDQPWYHVLPHGSSHATYVAQRHLDADGSKEVMYALSFKYQPEFGTQILRRGRSTPLDPSLPRSDRFMTSRVIIDCTTPYEWGDDERPAQIFLDEDMAAHVKGHWDEYFA